MSEYQDRDMSDFNEPPDVEDILEQEGEHTFIHEGVEYSRLSDRGREVWEAIQRDINSNNNS